MSYRNIRSCAVIAALLLAIGTFASTPLNQLHKQQASVNAENSIETNPADGEQLRETELAAVSEATEALQKASRALAEANIAEEFQELVHAALQVAEESVKKLSADAQDNPSSDVVIRSKKSDDASSYEVIIKSASEALDVAAERYVRAMKGFHGIVPSVDIVGTKTWIPPTRTLSPPAYVTNTRLLVAPEEFMRLQGAFLGITMAAPADNSEPGVEVAGVLPNSGAEEAGIQAGDRILSVGPVTLDSLDDPRQALMDYLKKREPGDSIKLKLKRDGSEIDLTVVTTARPKPEKLQADFGRVWEKLSTSPHNFLVFGSDGTPQIRRSFAIYGFLDLASLNPSLGKYFNTNSGALVLNAGGIKGLESGDVIIEIDGKAVKSKEQAYRLLSFADDSEVLVTVLREKKEMDLVLRLGE